MRYGSRRNDNGMARSIPTLRYLAILRCSSDARAQAMPHQV